jgi:opacity protein-like surface antigen
LARKNIEGWSVNAGLRYQFTPPAVRGSIKDGPVAASWGTYNWTGAYVGAFAGRTWVEENWRYVGFGSTVDPEAAGYLVGGQAGYNLQFGRVVVGIEGDYGFSNANGGKSCPNGFFFTCEAEVDRLAALTGRLGVTWGRALFYAKGGWAGGEVTAKEFLNTGGNPALLAFVTPKAASHWANGWTAGGGMEFALTDRWSAKAEYMHYDLGKDKYVLSNPPVDVADVSTQGDIVRIGINYHYGPKCCEAPLK